MTLDCTIGKIRGAPSYDPSMTDLRVFNCADLTDDQWDTEDHPDVDPCPASDVDVCEPGRTCYPRSSCRSGSSSFWDFWRDHAEYVYLRLRHYPNSSDLDVARLAPVADAQRGHALLVRRGLPGVRPGPRIDRIGREGACRQ